MSGRMAGWRLGPAATKNFPIMENQMEKNMENDMETREYGGYIGVILGRVKTQKI